MVLIAWMRTRGGMLSSLASWASRSTIAPSRALRSNRASARMCSDTACVISSLCASSARWA